jgi:ankyrin repeat protein
VNQSLPTRRLPAQPDLDHLKGQAKELRRAFAAGDSAATAEVRAHFRDADPSTFALHEAQLTIARAYGFASWPKLKAFIDGVTVQRLTGAVEAGDLDEVRTLLRVRPELAGMGNALHAAVVTRVPEMVRLLMEHGANAREGVYPHRDATTPLTLAAERGYDEIVAIIQESEPRRRNERSGFEGAPEPDALFQAIASGQDERAVAMIESDPALLRTRHTLRGWTALHAAAHRLNTSLAEWLLERGAEPSPKGWHDLTPLDLAAHWSDASQASKFARMAGLLLGRGAEMTARAAVASGDLEWLKARHREGVLENRIEDSGGLLRVAASHNRPEVLALLLEFGFDPDERMRFEEVGDDGVAMSWGMPLWHCAGAGKHEMAEMLLARGADPNAKVYASGSPMFQAFSQRDQAMVDLLMRYGGVPEATTAGLFRQTELARRMLAGEAAYCMDTGGDTLAEQLLWGGACGGDPEIVRMALERVSWPRDDIRWFHMLEQPLRIWTHGSSGDDPSWDRGTYLECFRLILERCDANLRGRMQDHGRFGLTILHSIAGSRDHVTAEQRAAFAAAALDAGARLDVRDSLLRSTPLGWACRWGRVELVKLFLERGADPVEEDAEAWARPLAWAEKKGHAAIAKLLRASDPLQ